jgi:hypothetical protein|tara:strand:+ start:1365 stop:1577 length:213 start_codon:yes stop_codon:yes gene_type:complete
MDKNIRVLHLIPVALIVAENVNSVVISGLSYDIKETIRMAKIEANYILNNNKLMFTTYYELDLLNLLKNY